MNLIIPHLNPLLTGEDLFLLIEGEGQDEVGKESMVMSEIAYRTAKDLRKRSTEAEQIFWNDLRNRRFLNLKFRKQHPIEFEYDNKKRFFIADFFCFEKQTVVEIDGGIHETQKDYDKLRTLIINELGMKVIRFSNDEVMNNIEKVKRDLTKYLS